MLIFDKIALLCCKIVFFLSGYKTFEFEGTITEEQPCTLCFANATIKMKIKPGEKRPDRPLTIELSMVNKGDITHNPQAKINLWDNFKFPSARLRGMYKWKWY